MSIPSDYLENVFNDATHSTLPLRQRPQVDLCRRGEIRAENFLDAATEVFAEKGYQHARLSEIVARAGGSLATLYRIFGDKEGLASAILERRLDMHIHLLSDLNLTELSPEQALRRVAIRMAQLMAGRDSQVVYRIVIGEVRGAEALDMLTAMNTGHDGSLTTIHANTARDALGRIENMVSMTGATFPIKAMRQQIASAIDVVIQLERQEDGKRRLVSVQEINGMEGEMITMTEIFAFVRRGMGEHGEVLGDYRPTGMVPAFRDVMAKRGIELPLSMFRPEWMEGQS